MTATLKRTPKDVTEFEREQLRFFLAGDNLGPTLEEFNPSLAWLPILVDLRVVENQRHLAPWIEKNFSDPDAIREVVANIQFFGSEIADRLQFSLDRMRDLTPLLVQSWRLIIRHMRTWQRGELGGEWFEIEPRIRRGEQSLELSERLAKVLRPKPKVSKPINWNDTEQISAPKNPSDLMYIEYEIEEGVSEAEVLSAWSEATSPQVDAGLLRLLAHELEAAISDAMDVGVESNEGYSTSDSDVPSVAEHGQNAYRRGFLHIVRVMAELWTRLARKSPEIATAIFDSWTKSPHRLTRRLALFAAADSTITATTAANLLLSIPQGELFLTNSTVEVYRLVRMRWNHFSDEEQRLIEKRFVAGPPAFWFREGADKDRYIDRCRFDILGEIQRSGGTLSSDASSVLAEIRHRHPEWELRPKEHAGFHSWAGKAQDIEPADAESLRNVAENLLVSEALEIDKGAHPFFAGSTWDTLCRSEPDRALRGLAAEASRSLWRENAWRSFLWSQKSNDQKPGDEEIARKIAELLAETSDDSLLSFSDAASWWLRENMKSLNDELLWRVWDRIEELSHRMPQEAGDQDE